MTDALRSLVVQVVSRVPAVLAATPFSEGYLETKRMAHELPSPMSTERV
jgi:hypothetical protein